MAWLHLPSYFLGGASLANAIPHFVSGTMGRSFQSPFATPSGEGLSSSTVNVLWGFANLVLFYLLVCRVGDFDLRNASQAAALGLGMLLVGLFAAHHFGRFHGGAPIVGWVSDHLGPAGRSASARLLASRPLSSVPSY